MTCIDRQRNRDADRIAAVQKCRSRELFCLSSLNAEDELCLTSILRWAPLNIDSNTYQRMMISRLQLIKTMLNSTNLISNCIGYINNLLTLITFEIVSQHIANDSRFIEKSRCIFLINHISN